MWLLTIAAIVKLVGMCIVFAHWEWRRDMKRLEARSDRKHNEPCRTCWGSRLPCARIVRR